MFTECSLFMYYLYFSFFVLHVFPSCFLRCGVQAGHIMFTSNHILRSLFSSSKVRGPNFELRTLSSELRALNFELRASISELQAPNFELRTHSSLKWVCGNKDMGYRDNHNWIRRSLLPSCLHKMSTSIALFCESTKAVWFLNRVGIVKYGQNTCMIKENVKQK